ncbi:glycoside hydrolase family 32 protein [Konateibacter massiliensis]|uniref:glycoside hydrolase family 32 protein n=1 Tax=Konateibacter massiliensis TaxID=2002841 RepID=UPI000C15A7F5|nr:glycoside hydrolase family 32 protein [Konateibacter massiliensis]
MESHIRYIKIKEKDKYLAIPIQAEKEKKKLFLREGGDFCTELNIPVGTGEEGIYEHDFFAYIPLQPYQGKELALEGEVTEAFLESIMVTDDRIKNRKHRPLLHFTPDYGWINDPNGLVYQNGVYHLYFQYNPFDTQWDNMSWGHAVSTDLTHWEQKDTVLFPDADGTIFSGCGLVNEFGLLDLPKEALLFYYSAAGSANKLSEGKSFVQKLAYSLDQGKTLIKGKTVLPAICKENRDPKVFWHEESKAYIMCLWLENNEFALLRSLDLKHFEISQRFELDGGFECPDLFRLSLESHGQSADKWVFWCADGFYYMGDFDGYEFHTDGIRREAYQTKIPYAAQTISNVGERVISIPWLRTKTKDGLYTGCMGLPREFSLIEKEGEPVLRQSLAREIEEKKKLVFSEHTKSDINLCWEKETLIVTIETPHTFEKGFTGRILGSEITYDAASGVLKVEEDEITIKQEVSDFCMIFDRGVIEITANNDIIYAVFEVEDKPLEREILLNCGEDAKFCLYEIIS